jgi:type IV pilus assembly protein PilC
MPIFVYSALTEKGLITHGEAMALSVDSLRQDLEKSGLLVKQIKKKRFSIKGRVAAEALLQFIQEFSALIRAGLSIPEALKLLQDQPDSPRLTLALGRVLDDVRQGVMLSQAFSVYPEVFDPVFTTAVMTAEKSGNLSLALNKYQLYLRQRVELRRKISQAMVYPLFLLVTLFIILGILFVFVLPRFVALYSDFGGKLPLPTQMLVSIVSHLHWYILSIMAGSLLIWSSWRHWSATEMNLARRDRMLERIPLMGKIFRYSSIAQLGRMLESMLAGGTPLAEALRVTIPTIQNRAMAVRLQNTLDLVIAGNSLTHAVEQSALMPRPAVKLVQVGEATGKLDNMLGEMAAFYEERVAALLARVMTLIEPILMLLMGCIIGGIVIVMYLPIFYIVEVIK